MICPNDKAMTSVDHESCIRIDQNARVADFSFILPRNLFPTSSQYTSKIELRGKVNDTSWLKLFNTFVGSW